MFAAMLSAGGVNNVANGVLEDVLVGLAIK